MILLIISVWYFVAIGGGAWGGSVQTFEKVGPFRSGSDCETVARQVNGKHGVLVSSCWEVPGLPTVDDKTKGKRP